MEHKADQRVLAEHVLSHAVMEIFEHLAPNLSTAIELEITQSKAAVDACHRAGVKHIVYSAMDDLPEGVTVPPAVSKSEGASLSRAEQSSRTC